MRVSLISGSWPPVRCGIGDYASRLATELSALGVVPTVIAGTRATRSAAHENVKVLAQMKTWHWRERLTLLAALSEEMPDLVNIQYPTQAYGRHIMINLLPWLIRRDLKIPVVFTVHEYRSFRWLGKLRIGISAALSTRVVVPDRENLRSIGKDFPVIRARLAYVPLGPAVEPLTQPDLQEVVAASTSHAEPHRFTIAYFGFLSPSKGIETLLGALDLLCAVNPGLDWRLLLIADREPFDARYSRYHRQVEALLENPRIRSRVNWTGYCPAPDVSRYLLSSSICVLPFNDGASLRRTTLLAALCHGLPVISTLPKGRLDPEIKDGQNILLVQPRDAAALALRIAELACQPRKRLELAKGALQLARQFSWSEIARAMLDVYGDAIRPPM